MASDFWNKAADTSPDRGVDVLCHLERRGVSEGFAVLYVDTDSGEWRTQSWWPECRKVTHWIPIPPLDTPLALDALATMRPVPQP